MRYVSRSLVDLGVAPDRDPAVDRTQHEVRGRTVRALPAARAVRLHRWSGARRTRRWPPARRTGGVTWPSDRRRWPSGSSPRATGASSRSSTARTSCFPLAGAVRIAYFPEATRGALAGPYDVSLVEGSVTTPSRRRADPGDPCGFRDPRDDRCLRDQRRDPGAAQLRRRRPSTARSSTPTRSTCTRSSTPRPSPTTSPWTSSCAGARSTSHQLLEILTALVQGRRPRSRRVQRLRRVQAPRQRVRRRRARHAVPRTGHAGRVRRPVPGVLARLLRLLRPAGHREHRVACRNGSPSSGCPSATSSACSARSPPRRRSSFRARAAPARASSPRRRRRDPQAHLRGPRPSRPTRWRASRARVRCVSSSATGRSTDVQLRIFEPPRFFEAFLRGRAWTEPPDITARICGICPVAYQMSSCLAIEDACGVEVPDRIRLMRRLLYCGEWIESHALHIYLLHAPDFLGYDGAVEMAADHRELVERGLSLKKAGNALMTLVGGRAVHPVNVRVGGFYRLPDQRDLLALRPRLLRASDDALDDRALGLDLRVPRLRADPGVRRPPRRERLSARGRFGRHQQRSRHRVSRSSAR